MPPKKRLNERSPEPSPKKQRTLKQAAKQKKLPRTERLADWGFKLIQ